MLAFPWPNWPVALFPQATTVPSAKRATVWVSPAATIVTPLRFTPGAICTVTGLVTGAVVTVPLPSCPYLLLPQATTVPSFLSATV